MALRWRDNGKGILLCAATHDTREWDLYIDDNAHYNLVVNKYIFPDANEPENGIWHWIGDTMPTDELQKTILEICKTPVPMEQIVHDATEKLPHYNYLTNGYIRNAVWYLIDCGEIELNADRLFVRVK